MTGTLGVDDRVVVITGASRGVGAVLARSFAEHGARLALLARDIEALEKLAAELPAETLPVSCDISDEKAAFEAFDRIGQHFGGIDSVIANAGIALSSDRAQNFDLPTWRRMIDINLTGSFITAQASYEYLADSSRGRLVMTSSVTASKPRRGSCAYGASKAGTEGLTRALAADWARDQICVNAVAPGFFEIGLGSAFAGNPRLREQIETRTSLGRFGHPRELADVVLFLAGDRASYLSGHVLAADGGYGLT